MNRADIWAATSMTCSQIVLNSQVITMPWSAIVAMAWLSMSVFWAIESMKQERAK